MQITKRNGEKKALEASKLTQRLFRLTDGLDTTHVNVSAVVDATIKGAYDGMTTAKIDELVCQTAAYLATKHPDYALLAGRLAVTNLHKNTLSSFSESIKVLHAYINPNTKEHAPLVTDDIYNITMANAAHLDSIIKNERDLMYDYFGYKTLERSYLICAGKQVVERPQYMLMRVALAIHGGNLERVAETYEMMSLGLFTHATPTLYNAGTMHPQMSSCFLIASKGDSIEGIYDTLTTCALISKHSGGIGLHIHDIRATGSYIRGTNGVSNGLVPMLRVYNDTARYVDQGGGKRKGSFAIYLEPWHGDIMEFLQLKKNTGKEEIRARDLFYGLWIPDLFMKRVQSKGKWTLFDPKSAPGLPDVFGREFEELYERYEKEGKGMRTIEAQEVWFAILEAQIETGTPYMLYKDACNSKSNQQNLGTIKCSNLCTEIIQYTSPEEVAVCNLASIALPKCVNPDGKSYDFEKLRQITRVATRNLNNVIDKNMYPVPEARNSNMKHRPIGLGVQGLADTFLLMHLPFTCPEAQRLNEDIFETMYFAALEESCELARLHGPYTSYAGSPMSQGKLQFDLWGVTPKSGRWDWSGLREKIAQFGVRNSLLLAPMPTASTSQILGNNECFEPYTSNMYLRRVLSGEFPVVNKCLVRDLIACGKWNDEVRNELIAANGSIQSIEGIDPQLKLVYRTVWEIKMKDIIDMAAARSAYIDQSQSLNLFLESPTSGTLTSMHFYAWRLGLKTGMYYLRSRPAVDAIKFTVDSSKLAASKTTAQKAKEVPSRPASQKRPPEPEECLACGS